MTRIAMLGRMRVLPVAVMLFLLFLGISCSEAASGRLDGSSNEAFQKSVKEMTQSLSGEKRQKFEEAMKFFLLRESFKQAFAGGGPDEDKLFESLRQQLGGLTADEVIAKADAIRNGSGEE